MLASLACTFLEVAFRSDSDQVARLTRLPTLTPTAISTSAAVIKAAEPASATPGPALASANKVTRGTVGWSFTGTRLDADPETNLLMLHGELINETGSA
jgi:hypothetical protein